MGPFAAVGLGLQGLGSVFGAIQGAKMLKEAKKIKPFYEKYKTSNAAKDMLGMAQTRLNAINPMKAAGQRQVQTSQANAMSGVNRNVTDSSQALAMVAGLQGQADQSMFNRDMQDAAFQQQNMANLMNAQNVMIGEDRMKYQDMMNKYMVDLNQKNNLRFAGQQNVLGAVQNLAGSLFGAQRLANDSAGNVANGGAGAGFAAGTK